MKCWICNERTANSEEHKFKASTLKKTYGKKYKKGELLYGSSDGIIYELDSFKSNHIKFPKIICEECNNTHTQPHDNSFDKLSNYIDTKGCELSNGIIDFEKIYGTNWTVEKRNLYKYIAKHAGCKILTINSKYDISDLSEFIMGQNNTTSLKIHFQYKEGIRVVLDYCSETPSLNLFNGTTTYFGEDENFLTYAGWISHNFISIVWVVSPFIDQTNYIDFNRKTEEVEFKSYSECDSLKNAKNIRECLDIVELSGINSFEKRLEFYKKVMKK